MEEMKLENFFNLRAEKQEHIINAALNIFGKNGYKKASIADIAGQAGIAKGMVMYYFGSKKNLYLYLVDMCGKIMFEEMQKGLDPNVTDFFDKVRMMTNIKVSMLKRHPALMSFMTNVYYESDDDVADDLKRILAEGIKTRQEMILVETDTSRLRDDIDPELLDRFLVWVGEGFGTTLAKPGGMELIDEYTEDLYKILGIMKKYFYK